MSLSVGNLTCYARDSSYEGTLYVGEMQSRKDSMKVATLLSLPEGMEIDQIQISAAGSGSLSRSATHPQSCCPLCSQPSSHIHSHYHRTLKDAPCVGRQLQLFLTVRKFFCRNPDCSRKVFTERLKQLTEPWARMTTRLKEHITSIGLATCGKGGVRLALA